MRNKKKAFSFITLVAIVASMSILPIFADTGNKTTDTQESNVTVSFEKKETEEVLPPVDPVDPTDPEEGDGGGDGGTGSEGNFTIDAVPKLDFGTIELDTTGAPATVKSTSLLPYVQISDRRQTGAGWELTAELSEFSHKETGSKINGATITLKDGSVKKVNSESTAPTIGSANIVIGQSDTRIMRAEKGGGLGTWIATWLEEDDPKLNQKVELNIPTKDAIDGDYEATITWTLLNQP